MNKKGKGVSATQGTFIALAVIMVFAVVYLAWSVSQDPAETSVSPPTALTEDGVVVPQGSVSCPSDGTTDGQVRYEDILASSTTFGTPQCYFMPETAGLERVAVGALQTGGTYSTAVDLKCTKAGTSWNVVCLSNSTLWQSVSDGASFVAEGAFVQRDVLGKNYDELKFKVEDKFTGGATFFNITGCNGLPDGQGSVGYTAFNGSQCIISDRSDGSDTALTIGADGYIDSRIFVKTNNTKGLFGEDGLRTWMLVDSNTDEWQEPIASVGTGDTLVSQIGNMAEKDKTKYTGFEYAYEIGVIGDREIYIDYYQETADGVNPASNDPVIEFCTEGRYDSSKEKDTIKIGCWTDATTQVQVTTGLRHHLTFAVT